MGAGAISARVERIRRGEDPALLARMPSGFAILGKYQPGPVRGACMLLPDPVVAPEPERSRLGMILGIVAGVVAIGAGIGVGVWAANRPVQTSIEVGP